MSSFNKQQGILDQVPKELQLHVLSFLTPGQLCTVRYLNNKWKGLADHPQIWKMFVLKREDLDEELLAELNKNQNWKTAFQQVSCLKWDASFNNQLLLSKDGLTATHHNPSCPCWCSTRTQSGWRAGKHKWAIEINYGTCNAGNVFVGIATESMRSGYSLGSDEYTWGVRGIDGFLYHSNAVLKHMSPFHNTDVVVVELDLESFTLSYYINGQPQPQVSVPELKGHTVFPAITLINISENVTLRPWHLFVDPSGKNELWRPRALSSTASSTRPVSTAITASPNNNNNNNNHLSRRATTAGTGSSTDTAKQGGSWLSRLWKKFF